MGFSIATGVPAFTVFLQGLLSFFSPCVLPLVPLYVSYLAGGAKTVDADGVIHYPRRRVLVNTLFFVLGVSFAFFVLGLGFTAVGRFFSGNQIWFARISGIIMILFGLYQFGVFGKSDALGREHRLLLRLDRWTMGPLPALLLGFTFSFAWTPCVGPTLGSVLLMASSAQSTAQGFVLIGIYTLGFVIPFLIVGLFTGTVLDFFKKHRNVVRYTVKVGAALLILMGIMTLTGLMNGFTGYLSSFGGATGGNVSPPVSTETQPSPLPTPSPTPTEKQKIPAPDFELVDQFGETHKLSDYQGKTVFLNFWMTWCGPCKQEMPDIQALYEAYGENSEDLVVLGISNPKDPDYPNNGDNKDKDEVAQFLEDNGYSYPVVMDLTGDVFAQYGIQAYPTTFMIDKEGNVFGYVPGALTADMMESIVQQTIAGEYES